MKTFLKLLSLTFLLLFGSLLTVKSNDLPCSECKSDLLAQTTDVNPPAVDPVTSDIASTDYILQDSPGPAVPESPSKSLNDLIIFIMGLITTITLATESVKRVIEEKTKLNGRVVQILSWVLGIGLTLVAQFFDLSFLAELDSSSAALYGFGASLASNGLYDSKIFQRIFSLFRK